MRRVFLVGSFVILCLCLNLITLPSPGFALSNQETVRLFKEALRLGKAGNEQDFRKALSILRRIEGLCHTPGQALNCAYVQNQMGLAYVRLQEYSAAQKCYQKALSLFKDVNNPKMVGQVLTNVGMLQYQWGNYEEAEKSFERSLPLLRRYPCPKEN